MPFTTIWVYESETFAQHLLNRNFTPDYIHNFNICLTHPLEKLLCAYSRPGVDAELHLRDLLVNLLHELDDEVDQLVPVHLVRVEVGDEEADVVPLDRLPPQDHKVFRPPHHEAHELVTQQSLDLVGLPGRQ